MVNHSEYFEKMYECNDDPWSYTKRWYEQRKREICLALLLKPHYPKILELGCGNGILSQLLAGRCDELICIDANARAVQLAQSRLKAFKHVQVIQRQIPIEYPESIFDVIVISEIAYYLNIQEILKLVQLCQKSLTKNGMILCCHWRYPIENFSLNGGEVHQIFKQNFSLSHYLSLNDKDFLVDLWTKETFSLACSEGLL